MLAYVYPKLSLQEIRVTENSMSGLKSRFCPLNRETTAKLLFRTSTKCMYFASKAAIRVS